MLLRQSTRSTHVLLYLELSWRPLQDHGRRGMRHIDKLTSAKAGSTHEAMGLPSSPRSALHAGEPGLKAEGR